MKKTILAILICFSLHAFAATIYCPTTITCTEEGDSTICHANPALGSTWALLDAAFLPEGYAGTFPWRQAGNIGDSGGWCNYETHNAGKKEFIYFSYKGLIYPDLAAKDNGWNSVGHGCWSETNDPEQCPFTDRKP